MTTTPAYPTGTPPNDTTWVPIAVRGYLVPDAQALERHRRDRHTARRQDRAAPPAETPRADAPPQGPAPSSPEEPALDPEELRALVAILGPLPWFTLTLDNETLTAPAQALRVGYYEVRGLSIAAAVRRYRHGRLTPADLDAVVEAGFIVGEPLTDQERETIQQVAAERSWRRGYRRVAVRSAEAFVDEVFYPWAYSQRALVIGHNLFFDLSRFATDWGPGAKRFRGGFWLKLCSCPHTTCWRHPPLQYKSLGRFKGLYRFRHVTLPGPDGQLAKKTYDGRFLDTLTLGRALLGPGDLSLKGLGTRFRASVIKRDAPDFDGPVDDAFLDYLVDDVRATYWLAVAERDLYRRHGVGRDRWTIYSEASLGKAHLHDLRVPTAARRAWAIPDTRQGHAMTAYFGGRAEVHIRLRPTEVIPVDFKSQYPTVNALLGLQGLWLARAVTVRHGPRVVAEVRRLLADPHLLDWLQRPEHWRRLRVFVRLRPRGDVLPVRASFAPGGAPNIAVAPLTSRTPLWYALADVLTSVLATGRPPGEVLDAFELVPGPDQVETRPFALFGDERYRLDLRTDDFFAAVIDLRTRVKADMRAAKRAGETAEWERLNGLQLALKLLANATSYGVLVEVNEELLGTALPVDVYALDTHRRTGDLVERPGPYFAGALGPLIPAGGRLLLGIAERLAADRGLTYALCDTDCMHFARSAEARDLDRRAFEERVRAICAWFQPLSPYRDRDAPLFELEEENCALVRDERTGEEAVDAERLEPLWALAVSAKRYVLYNRLPDGTVRLRKFSSHGLGLWGRRGGYVRPAHVPPPHTLREERDAHGRVCRVPDSAALGGPEWVYDLWYDCVTTLETGRYPDGRPLRVDRDGVPRYVVPDSAWLVAPAFYQLTISTWKLWRQFQHLDGLRPGNFITVLPPPDVWSALLDEREGELREDEAGDAADVTNEHGTPVDPDVPLSRSARYTGYCKTVEDVLRAAREGRIARVADGAALPAGVPLTSMAEVLRDYFQHPETKAANPQGVGELRRRHVVATDVWVIGKESNRLTQMVAEETNGTLGARAMLGGRDYGPTGDGERLASLLGEDIPDLMAATGLPRSTVYALRHAAGEPSAATRAALHMGLLLLDPENPAGIAGWREALPTAEILAQVVGGERDRARRLWGGKAQWTPAERARLVAYMSAHRYELAPTAPPSHRSSDPPVVTVCAWTGGPSRCADIGKWGGEHCADEIASCI
jgi:hypothetical protein